MEKKFELLDRDEYWGFPMNNIVLHIPHSCLKLPFGFLKNAIVNKEVVKNFNNAITDLYTSNLFGKNKYSKVITKYSRIYCDVEKFADDSKEIMSKFGMGFVYTHTNTGKHFFNPSEEYKTNIFSNYYIKHHNKLDSVVSKTLEKGTTLLIDCHSFSRDIIMFEDKKNNLPDICIGFDELYNSEKLVNYIKTYFENCGYNVQFNYPYSGTIIPNKYFKEKANNLFCVMIEINKNLYIYENNNKNSNFQKLRNQIQTLLHELENLNV